MPNWKHEIKSTICKITSHNWSEVTTHFEGVDYSKIGVGIQWCERCALHRHVALSRVNKED